MTGFRHVSTRLICWILGGTAAALLALGCYQQNQNRRIVLEQATGRSTAIAASITEELQGALRAVETSVRLTAARLESHPATPAETDTMLRQMVGTNGRIYGGTAAFEPFAAPSGLTRFAPYIFRQADHTLAHADLATSDYAYWNQDWYRVPLAQKSPRWAEPYFDEGGGNIQMVTYAVPFTPITSPGGLPGGVVTADVALAWLKLVAESNRPGRNGFVIVFSGSGRIITHPNAQLVMAESLASLAEKNHHPELLHVQREVAAGRSGSLSYDAPALGSRVHIDFRPVRIGGWGVIVGYDETEFLSPVRTAGQITLWSGLGALLVLAALIVFISRWITLPLTHLATTADAIARGELDVAITPPRTRDEVGHLTDAFRRMRDDLRHYIADLATATAAKQKLESELAIAQQIQRTMLPAPRHTQPGSPAVQLTARMVPAKAVGGDLYVYFSPAPDRLCFAVGDVSDKGVPAALFMARTITLLKTIGRETTAPGEILHRVNAELCPDNDECMFVTLFCGLIDLTTGAITAACAGHELPIILSAGGGARLWEIPAGPALGLEANITLPVAHTILAPGETLLLYSDGVTDAANLDGAMFTLDGLMQAARELGPTPDRLTDELLRRVEAFAADAPQADDITLFALHRQK